MDLESVVAILERLETKIDKHQEHVHEIDKTLVRNTASLEEHMKRTEMNEEAIELLRKELQPVRTHVTHVEAWFKLIVGASIVIGILSQVLDLFN